MWRTFALFVDRFLCLTHRTQTNKILYEPTVPVVMLKSARNQWKSSAWRITVLRVWLSRGLIKLQECYPAPTPAEESEREVADFGSSASGVSTGREDVWRGEMTQSGGTPDAMRNGKGEHKQNISKKAGWPTVAIHTHIHTLSIQCHIKDPSGLFTQGLI